MEDDDKRRLALAWLQPKNLDRMTRVAKRCAHVFREDPEDLLQRVLEKIMESDLRFAAGDDVVRLAEPMLRNMYANEKRTKRATTTEPMKTNDEGEEVEPPASSSKNPEKKLQRAEREEIKASLFRDAEDELKKKGGDVAQRAAGLIDCMRRGIDDPDEIAKELDIPASQVKKARELLAETLRAIAKRRGKDLEALRGSDE